jgi:hypothetical protein
VRVPEMSDSEDLGFMEAQKKINELHTQGIQEVKSLLVGFIKGQQSTSQEEGTAAPPAKKRKRNDGTQEDVVQLHISPGEEIEDANESEDDGDDVWRTQPMHGKSLLGDGELGDQGTEDSLEGEDSERNLGSKYQELLDQTEEVLGDPISEDLAEVCKKVWGQSVLTTEKKKQLFKGLDIPQNCLVLKAPRLNTKVYIRVNENAQTKDKGAQERQKGLSRAVIPLLHGMGDLDKTQIALHKQYQSLKEPKTLEEAKKQIKLAKAQAQAAYESTNEVRLRMQKSVSVLAYVFTQTTKKRKQDICWALGKEFSAYAQDTKTGEEDLFPEDAIKAMKAELKAVKPKGQKESSTYSKNSTSFGKTHRGQNTTGGKKTYSGNSGSFNAYNRFNSKSGNSNFSNNNSNNNNNNNNNSNNSFHKKRK